MKQSLMRAGGSGLALILAGLAGILTAPACAAEATRAADAIRTCSRCHDAADKYPVLSILKSKHAVMADPGTPFADQACVTCHQAAREGPQDASKLKSG